MSGYRRFPGVSFRRATRCLTQILVVTLSGIIPLASLHADQVPAVADVHVNAAFSGTNFGNSPYLQVGGGSRAFVRFDLSSLPPGVAASNLSRVNLVLG